MGLLQHRGQNDCACGSVGVVWFSQMGTVDEFGALVCTVNRYMCCLFAQALNIFYHFQ